MGWKPFKGAVHFGAKIKMKPSGAAVFVIGKNIWIEYVNLFLSCAIPVVIQETEYNFENYGKQNKFSASF